MKLKPTTTGNSAAHPDTRFKNELKEKLISLKVKEREIAAWMKTHSTMDREYDKQLSRYNLLVTKQVIVKKQLEKETNEKYSLME